VSNKSLGVDFLTITVFCLTLSAIRTWRKTLTGLIVVRIAYQPAERGVDSKQRGFWYSFRYCYSSLLKLSRDCLKNVTVYL
jgi:hypothetical protein